MDFPDLTCCVLTYKDAQWGALTLLALRDRVAYSGRKRFHIADGGSPQQHLDLYREILTGLDYGITVSGDLASQLNACAENSGDVWFYCLDDFTPMAHIDLTPDVRMLLTYPDAGLVRMGRLAFYECEGAGTGFPHGVYARMVAAGGLHWWITDKARTVDPYMCAINAGVMHRRFWDAYGPLPPIHPHRPGEAELVWARQYNERPGPSVALPVRFGENDQSTHRYNLEPIQHLRPLHGEDYENGAGKWAST